VNSTRISILENRSEGHVSFSVAPNRVRTTEHVYGQDECTFDDPSGLNLEERVNNRPVYPTPNNSLPIFLPGISPIVETQASHNRLSYRSFSNLTLDEVLPVLLHKSHSNQAPVARKRTPGGQKG
jgi:hypothetical protein